MRLEGLSSSEGLSARAVRVCRRVCRRGLPGIVGGFVGAGWALVGGANTVGIQSHSVGPQVTGPRVLKSQVKDTFEAVMATVCVPEGCTIVRNGSCKLLNTLHCQS